MKAFEFQIETIDRIADSGVLDRLAELVYSIEELIDPLLGLNDDGSLSASFVVEAPDALTASKLAADLFSAAVSQADPLREPTDREIEHGNEQVRRSGRFEVRETVYA